jgi:membrane-associated phospholipid phosphatase
VVHRKNENDSRLLALPKGDALRGNLMLSLAFAAYFWIVYGTGDFVAAHAAERFHVAIPFEQSIPFVPWAAVIYLTVTPLFCLAPFIFRTPDRLLPLFVTMCVQVTRASEIFCLFPVELSFPPHEVAGAAGFFYRLAGEVALTYNCVPSLHVALALTCAFAYASVGGRPWRIFVWCWVAAIVASTLLAHQHHLADLAAGALLSLLAVRYVPPRVRQWLQARSDQGQGTAGSQAMRAIREPSTPAGSMR